MRGVAVLLFALASFAPARGQEDAPDPTASARQLADDYLSAYRARFPAADPSNGRDLFDNRPDAEAEWGAREAAFLGRVQRVAPELPSGTPEQITMALLQERLEMDLQMRACRRELWNVSPLTGWLNEYRILATRQPVGTDEAREATLGRWAALPGFIDREIANLRAGLDAGYSAPRQLVESTVDQAEEILAAPLEDSPFFSPAERDTTPTFRAAILVLVRDSISPALQRYRDFLATEYAPRARTSVGVGALPNGRACFRALVRRYTTIDEDPARLESQGRALLARPGGATALNRQQAAAAEPANQFRSSDEVLATMAAALRRAADGAPEWFNHLPDPLIPEVDSMPDAGPTDPDAFYVSGDGTEPPRVYVNISRMLEPGARLFAERLAFHEGIPGHHFQIALQRSGDAHPLNRALWTTALGEGWAVYAAGLADEMGLYSSESARLGLAVSDIEDGATFLVQYGIHGLGWTRAQAADTLNHYLGGDRADIERQVDYFIAAPAHALAYPMGARFLLDLRSRTAARLGARFDVRGFHDVVLGAGTIPLQALSDEVDRWARSLSSDRP